MSGLLEAVVAASRRSASERERAHDRRALAAALDAAAPRAELFLTALRAPGIRVIAECKRRSPSRGVLRDAYDPVAMARAYETAGAAAISVLTEPTFFDGDLSHLSAVRAAVSVPVLRKDFIVTPFQLDEARAAGADAVLLIVAALTDETLRHLLSHAQALDLATLVEVHDSAEAARALDAGAVLVGVNSRDLRSLDVAISRFDEMAPLLPGSVVAVAESGLRSPRDLARLHDLRYDAFLIGERLVVEDDPGRALRQLLDAAGKAAP